MKKQLALVLLTGMALPTASALAMDKSKMQSQAPKSEIANNCNTCKKDLNITNSCTRCKDLCKSCLEHKQKLEESENYRSSFVTYTFGGVSIAAMLVLLGTFAYGAITDKNKQSKNTDK